MNTIKVSALSYTNSKPFVYGLTHAAIASKIDLTLNSPSTSAYKLVNKEVSIGLVPVAILLHIPDYKIISDYCIGATGAVNSVFIFSNKPIYEIKTIRLDSQSKTSNALTKILIKNYWKTSPKFVQGGDVDAYVEIGDRTFGKKEQYKYPYDLSEEWNRFTGLPFVFAVWATINPFISLDFIDEFNLALKLGLDKRNEVISELPQREDFDLKNYLSHQIDFNFDSQKKEALRKFLNLVQKL